MSLTLFENLMLDELVNRHVESGFMTPESAGGFKTFYESQPEEVRKAQRVTLAQRVGISMGEVGVLRKTTPPEKPPSVAELPLVSQVTAPGIWEELPTFTDPIAPGIWEESRLTPEPAQGGQIVRQAELPSMPRAAEKVDPVALPQVQRATQPGAAPVIMRTGGAAGLLPGSVIDGLVDLDKQANALLGGDPDETISSRAGRGAFFGPSVSSALCTGLDLIDPGHCTGASIAHQRRVTRSGIPTGSVCLTSQIASLIARRRC